MPLSEFEFDFRTPCIHFNIFHYLLMQLAIQHSKQSKNEILFGQINNRKLKHFNNFLNYLFMEMLIRFVLVFRILYY